MILIADSGSTKTKWCLVNNNEIKTCNTSGINPFYLTSDDITNILNTEFTLNKETISSIFFYGAGCALPEKKQILFNCLKTYFNITTITIESDLVGAAHSLCQSDPGIVCILGTGSNSCYYDGNKIINNISPLGYIIGDEGSGAVLGKKLISDIFKNQLPKNIIDTFFNEYSLTTAELLENIYRKPFPNRFLAQYTKFIAKHISEPAIESLVYNGFKDFFCRNVLQYKESLTLPIHFTGSIAYVFKEILIKTAAEYNLIIGKISQDPIDGLIQYHNK